MPRSKKNTNFEQSLSDLEALVNEMEAGDLSLEDSLKAFEKGITLTRECQDSLSAAEQKVQMLVEKQNELTEEPFNTDPDRND